MEFLNQINMPLALSITAFVLTMLFVIGLHRYFYHRNRLKEVQGKVRQDFQSAAGAKKSWILTTFQVFGQGAAPKTHDEYTRMQTQFYKAGIRNTKAPAIFLGAKFLLLILLAVGFLAIRLTVLKIFNPQATMFITIILAAIGFYIPDIWLRIKTAQRQRAIFEGFPDALDLLRVLVNSGMGLDAAIDRVGKEIKISNQAVSEEFRLLNLELRTGKDRVEALKNLGSRTDIEDVKNLVAILIQTERLGTDVTKALRTYSDTFRTNRYQIAEEKAGKLPVKLVFPLVLFIFPPLFLVIAGPAVIRISQVLLQLVD